jgi:molybdate transport system substrate-binding protein
MKGKLPATPILTGILCILLLAAVVFTGCISGTSPGGSPETAAPSSGTSAPAPAASALAPAPAASQAAGVTATAAAAPAAIAATPAPVYTYAEGNVVAFTAASLKGVSPKLAEGFVKMYPGHTIVFNLDGTQNLKTQVQNGAYADVFISASNSYTNELKKGGYFSDSTVKTLTTNYVIVILPVNNPAKIQSLADLAKPGVKIARAAKTVPVGAATDTVLANLAKSTYGEVWNTSISANTVTYETAEPSVATKVALGEVDAGFVYESTAVAAKPGTYSSIAIPKKDNFLQTYTIGVLKGSTSRGAASDFETFMLSDAGQQILKDYGFRPA